MGRRALRKVDPALDLTPYFREAADLPANFDQETIDFANAGDSLMAVLLLCCSGFFFALPDRKGPPVTQLAAEIGGTIGCICRKTKLYRISIEFVNAEQLIAFDRAFENAVIDGFRLLRAIKGEPGFHD